MLKAPFQLLASGVRAVETINADVMKISLNALRCVPPPYTGRCFDRWEYLAATAYF
jgi:hypothetical protein